MSLEKHILKDLQSGQASAAALADTLGKNREQIQAILTRLVKEGKLTSFQIAETITVYRLA